MDSQSQVSLSYKEQKQNLREYKDDCFDQEEKTMKESSCQLPSSSHHIEEYDSTYEEGEEDFEGEDMDVLLPPPSWILDCLEDGSAQELSSIKFDETQSTCLDDERTEKDLNSEEHANSCSRVPDNPLVLQTPAQEQEEDSSTQCIPCITNKSSKLSPKANPTWREQIHKEFSTTLPLAARELVQTSLRTIVYHARVSYAERGLKYHRNSELGNTSGYFLPLEQSSISSPNASSSSSCNSLNSLVHHSHTVLEEKEDTLPPFSSLSWVDRQLVSEWRTIQIPSQKSHTRMSLKNSQKDTQIHSPGNSSDPSMANHITDDEAAIAISVPDEDAEYDLARIRVPKPISRPKRAIATKCQKCQRSFNRTLSRHHCRLCGGSFCHDHSSLGHKLPHLDYNPNVPERVCDGCKAKLVERDLAERIAWRMARCRDFLNDDLTPYFETGVDTVEDAAIRIARATIRMAKQIPLGAQATVAVETVDVLRKHGLKGVYGIVLRKEFMAAADLLCKVTGINKRSWPLSVHELSAAIFYALAQHRALRGNDPEREQWMHSLVKRKAKEDWRREHNLIINKADNVLQNFEKNGKDTSEEKKEQGSQEVEVSSLNGNSNLEYQDQTENNEVIDENDVYDPMEQSYADLLVMADLAIKSKQQKKDSTKSNSTRISDNHKENKRSVSGKLHTSPKHDQNFRSQPEPSSASAHYPFSERPPQPKDPVCEPVSDSLLSSLLFYAPVAMNFIYCTNAVDIQLLAAQQNWHLLYANLEQDATLSDRPASALFVHRSQKIACFAVRGTATINDVVTDIRAMPVPFPDNPLNGTFEDDWMPVDRGQGLALCGMARSAGHLFREHIDALAALAEKGYRIRITGHSLGGGVAALLGALVRQFFEKRTQSGDSLRDTIANGTKPIGNSLMDQNDMLRVYTYAIPACVDAKLADFCKGFVTSVVCHDDVIPRLTPTSIRALLKHLLHIRKTWVKAHLEDDIKQIADRLKGGWAPRWRGSFTLIQQNQRSGLHRTAKSSKKWVEQKMKNCRNKLHLAKSKFSKKSTQSSEDLNAEASSMELHSRYGERGYDKEKNTMSEKSNGIHYDNAECESNDNTLYDGDFFYEAAADENELLEEEEDEAGKYNNYHNAYGELYSAHFGHSPGKKQLAPVIEDEWVPFDEPPMDVDPIPDCSSDINDNDERSAAPIEEEATTSTDPVMLEEMTLPRMFIPGKIVHIYTHNGGYNAACVPRTFRELRRISLAGNMLSDHTCKSYYEAMLEVRSIRKAPKPLPKWTSFGEDVTCSCCASPFTWASTSSSEAQEARDKHNCRACGGLVCDPCSKNRIPLPQIGFQVPMRVCDRCYFDLGGALNGESGNSLTMSYLGEEEQSSPSDSSTSCDSPINETDVDHSKAKISVGEKKIVDSGLSSKRSVVVDDLANRIKLSSMYG